MAGVVFGDVSRREWALVAFISAVVALAYGLILFRSTLIYGIDGPYYLIQVRSILETGMMSYVDPPFCFYFFALLSLVLGDATVTVKIGTIFFCALTVIPAYLIGKRTTTSIPAALTSAVVCSLSPGLMALSGEFVKNAVGSFFLLGFIYMCLRMLKGDDGKTTKGAAIVAFILTALTHILDLGLALLYLTLLSIASFALGANKKRFLMFSLPLLAGSAVLGAAAYFVYAGYTIDIGKGLTFVSQFLGSLEDYDTRDLMLIVGQGLAYLSAAAGVVASILYYRRRRVPDVAFIASSTAVLVLLNFPTIPGQWAWRFSLMSFVPLSSILGGLIGLASERDLQWGAMALLVPLFLLTQTLPGMQRPRPSIMPDEYRDLVQMAGYVPPHSRVVAKVGGRYWVEYLFDSKPLTPAPSELANYPVYFISGRGAPPPPPNSALVYRGEVLALYVAQPRTRS